MCVFSNSDSTVTSDPSHGDRSSLAHTVQVVPQSSGGYHVLRPTSSISSLQRPLPVVEQSTADVMDNMDDVASLDMHQQTREQRLSWGRLRKDGRQRLSSLTQSLTSSFRSSSAALGSSLLSLSSGRETRSTLQESLISSVWEEEEDGLMCSCQLHHSHTFPGPPSNMELKLETDKLLDTLTASTHTQLDTQDTNDDLLNIFWIPSLSFHPYRHGDKQVTVFSAF